MGLSSSSLLVRQQPLELLDVRGRDHGLTGVAARAAARLDLEMVATPRLGPDPLAGSGFLEALCGSLVRLDLRHSYPCSAGFASSAASGSTVAVGAIPLAVSASPIVSPPPFAWPVSTGAATAAAPSSPFFSIRFSSGAITMYML